MPRALPSLSRRAPPRLWNAKKQIDRSRGLVAKDLQELAEDPFSQRWRSKVSQDIVDFVEEYEGSDALGQPKREMLPEQKQALLKHPVRFFSRPHNVPESQRKQIYFPDFTVTLLRTPHLGPQYASFEVPLWFGKLDLKSYLKNLYQTEVNHIRSFVVHQTSVRKDQVTKYQRGAVHQPTYKKKMTVQLLEPFLWPAELSKEELDSTDYEKNKYWDSNMAMIDESRKVQAQFVDRPDLKQRRSIAQQAKALLAGREKWEPTWKQLPPDVRVLEGRQSRSLPPQL